MIDPVRTLNLNGAKNLPALPLTFDLFKKVFDNIEGSDYKTKLNFALTCRSFYAIGLKSLIKDKEIEDKVSVDKLALEQAILFNDLEPFHKIKKGTIKEAVFWKSFIDSLYSDAITETDRSSFIKLLLTDYKIDLSEKLHLINLIKQRSIANNPPSNQLQFYKEDSAKNFQNTQSRSSKDSSEKAEPSIECDLNNAILFNDIEAIKKIKETRKIGDLFWKIFVDSLYSNIKTEDERLYFINKLLDDSQIDVLDKAKLFDLFDKSKTDNSPPNQEINREKIRETKELPPIQNKTLPLHLLKKIIKKIDYNDIKAQRSILQTCRFFHKIILKNFKIGSYKYVLDRAISCKNIEAIKYIREYRRDGGGFFWDNFIESLYSKISDESRRLSIIIALFSEIKIDQTEIDIFLIDEIKKLGDIIIVNQLNGMHH